MKQTLAVVGLIVGLACVGAASANAAPQVKPSGGGTPTTPVTIDFQVSVKTGGDPAAIAAGLVGELYTAGGAFVSNCDSTVLPGPSSLTVGCTVANGTYVIGVDGVPATHYVSSVGCTDPTQQEIIDDPGAEFSAAGVPINCDVDIDPIPILWIDKVVDGGAATASDFTIEIYDSNGVLVTTVVDPSDGLCEDDPDEALCASVALVPGDYMLGEEFVTGYAATSSECSVILGEDNQIVETEFDEFSHGDQGDDTGCVVENTYVEELVEADIVVVNDDGGSATGADFTIEVYDADGVLVDSGTDPEPGIDNGAAEFTLPIGDYTFGVSGPAGYDASVVVTVGEVQVEAIDDPAADFSLGPFEIASGVITVNDTPTTTTTTTTTTPTTSTTTTDPTTTTVAPSTTTTIFGLLPPTGDDDSAGLALVALGLVLMGGGALAAARRR